MAATFPEGTIKEFVEHLRQNQGIDATMLSSIFGPPTKPPKGKLRGLQAVIEAEVRRLS